MTNRFQFNKNFIAGFLIYIFCLLTIGKLSISHHKYNQIAFKDFKEVFIDIKFHNSFNYITKETLNNDFFKNAEASLKDEAVYIVLSNTRTASCKIISLFTKNAYNHVSISMDKKLKTLISYNGGNKRNSPGLNQEFLGDIIKNENSSALVYKLFVTESQKKNIYKKIKEINNEGSSYNMLGLFFNKSIKPNIMYCSQFVYSLLKDANASYFSVVDKKVKPTDFIELDYHRKLTYCYEIK